MRFIKSRILYYKSRESLYQYYKSRENSYQVLQVICAVSERAMKLKVPMIKYNEIEGSYDKIIITIVPDYTRKNIT